MAHTPAPLIISRSCLPVHHCLLPASAPQTNGALHLALEAAEAAWAECAAQVDMVITCQQAESTDK